MSCIVQSHGGYVLKYVGDAVIAFFPSGYNKLLACDRAVQCAKSMITVIKNGINPILNQYDYPELRVKIGLDEEKVSFLLSLNILIFCFFKFFVYLINNSFLFYSFHNIFLKIYCDSTN